MAIINGILKRLLKLRNEEQKELVRLLKKIGFHAEKLVIS